MQVLQDMVADIITQTCCNDGYNTYHIVNCEAVNNAMQKLKCYKSDGVNNMLSDTFN